MKYLMKYTIYDKKYYFSLDKKIKNEITFYEFINFERMSCEEILYYIDKFSEVLSVKGDYLERTLEFINYFDLDMEKLNLECLKKLI